MATKEREGSRMVLGGNEVYIRRMFPPEMIKDESGVSMPNGTAIVETMEGAYLFLNGEFVKEREALETLPAQHQPKALAWWDKKFGNGGDEVEAKAIPSTTETLATLQHWDQCREKSIAQQGAMASIQQEASSESVSILESLAAQIASLQEQIASLQEKIAALQKRGNGRRAKRSPVRHKREASKQMGAEA